MPRPEPDLSCLNEVPSLPPPSFLTCSKGTSCCTSPFYTISFLSHTLTALDGKQNVSRVQSREKTTSCWHLRCSITFWRERKAAWVSIFTFSHLHMKTNCWWPNIALAYIYLYQAVRINTTKALRDQTFSSKKNSAYSTLSNSSPHPSNESFISSRTANHILLPFFSGNYSFSVESKHIILRVRWGDGWSQLRTLHSNE